jgi:hypothetical protein
MKKSLITIFVLVGCMVAQQTTTQQARSSEDSQPQVTLCDMVANPDIYDGKTVKVTATLLAGIEDAAVFIDDSCRPALEKSTQIVADFKQGEYSYRSSIAKRLTKLLKKKQQAAVTVLAVFAAQGHYIGHQNCCRYRLEVQRLLAVKELKPEAVHDRKDLHSDLLSRCGPARVCAGARVVNF